jgi:hypothetical protein
MSGGTKSSVSKIATVLVLIPICIVAWFAAPFVLPVYRWQYVDFAALAKQFDVAESELRQEYTMVVFYHPRVGVANDPSPFQIVESSPSWKSVNPKNIDEALPTPLLVRCSLFSDKDGEPISKLWIHNLDSERFFKIRCWRLPPGALGKNPKRPVLLYSSFETEDPNYGVPKKEAIAGWENDDHMRERDDGIGPP